MAKKKVCRTCRMLVEGSACPLHPGASLGDGWKGRIYVADPERSFVAEKVGLKVKGEYALKVQ